MPSTQAKFATKLVKILLANWFQGNLEDQRKRNAASTRFIPKNNQVTEKLWNLDHLQGSWFIPKTLTYPDRTILYFHGGAYALGSVKGLRDLISRLAQVCKCSVLSIDYRLAPEHPFPAALEDSLHTWKWLLSQDRNPSNLILAGDSAGGGLAIATALSLRDQGMALPAGIIGFSPWLDLTLSGPSIKRRADKDPYLKAEPLAECAGYYAGNETLDHPLVSPLFANLKELPPVLLHSGRNDILLDDTRRFTYLATKAGVKATMEIYSGLFHVFQTLGFLPETNHSLYQVAEFFDRVVQKE
jgi:monoterpene epsilon-lactone hydrolase